MPSKIYLSAYNGPISGYAIAQEIYGKKPKSTPPTSKIYEWIKKMKLAHLLSKTEKGYISNAEPLLKEIIEVLETKDIALTEAEKRTVLKLINSAHFRIATRIMSEDENKLVKDTDAVAVLLQTVGIIAFYLYVAYVRVTIREVSDDKEDINENTVNDSDITGTRITLTLNEGPEGLNQFEDGIFSSDQKYHEEAKKIWLGGDRESRSQFILLMAGLHGNAISKELTEKLCELSFFKYLFAFFSNERTFKLLEHWRKRTKEENHQK